MEATFYLEAVSSGSLRAGLRIYFVMVQVLVAWLGDQCLELRTKLKLLREEQVAILEMTGWLRGLSLIKIAFQLRRLPGGFLGTLMVSSAVLALISDLVVSGLVREVYFHSRCTFDKGLSIMATEVAGSSPYPSATWSAAEWASSAQVTSLTNGGEMGIYYQVDNSARFAADHTDIAGRWTCLVLQNKLTYDPVNWTDTAILDDLINKDLVYNGTSRLSRLANSFADSNVTTQLLIITTDTLDNNPTDSESNTTRPWSARIAVDTADILTDSTQEKHMAIYHCTLLDNTTTKLVEHIQTSITIDRLLAEWLHIFVGKLWDESNDAEPHSPAHTRLELVLNTIVMVAGSDNAISWAAATTGIPNYGCLKAFALVPWPVTLCFASASGLGVFFLAYAAYLAWAVAGAASRYDKLHFFPSSGPGSCSSSISNSMLNTDSRPSSSAIRNGIPNSLLEWMQHAVYEASPMMQKPRLDQLCRWRFAGGTGLGRARTLGIVGGDDGAGHEQQ